MMTSFKKLQISSYPVLSTKKINEDELFWKKLEFPVTIKSPGAVTHIEFKPQHPHHYLVTSGSKVNLFSSFAHQPLKTFHKFSDVVYSASYREDGELFVVGGEDNQVRVVHEKLFDQVFKGHSRPVHITKFLGKTDFFSGSDDKTVKVWDVTTKSELLCYMENDDYIRCGSKPANEDLFVIGSYDHTIKLFDKRTSSSVLTMQHFFPVEDVLIYPSANIVVSAGGSHIKIWDLINGGKLLQSIETHHKTVTCLAFSMHHRRVVSGSLDRQVKFHDISSSPSYVTHSLSYPSSILSIAFAPDDHLIAVGSVDSMLTLRKRKINTEVDKKIFEKNKRSKRIIENDWASKTSVFVSPKIKKFVATPKDDVVIEHKKKEHISKYDKRLKKFQYSKALDEAMSHNLRVNSPDVTLSLMKELRRRQGLKAALAGREDKDLSLIITFLLKNFYPPNITFITYLFSLILEIYEDEWGDFPRSLEVLRKLIKVTSQAENFLLESMELMGVVQTLMTIASTNSGF